MKTLKLFPTEKIEFGGDDLTGQRKEARPFSPNCPMFLTIKAKRPVFELLKTEIIEFQEAYSDRWGVKLYGSALNWDHMHTLVQARDRRGYNNFVRCFTSAISRKHGFKGLFPERPHTRLVKWGRDFEGVLSYLELNRTEAQGFNRAEAREILFQKKSGRS